jgi:XRE family aerobic/anaerobic benzoate catabolism transcriptional regulator
MLRDRTHVVWLRARPQDHWDRVVAQGDGRPMAGRPRAMAELKALFAARQPLYAQAHRVVKTTGASIERLAAELSAAIGDLP